MLEKKIWPNVLYAVILFIVCVTIWQVTNENDQFSSIAIYNLYTSNSSYSYPIDTLSIDDYHQLINLPNFTFPILTHPCNDTHPILLVLIHSNPKNFLLRKTVRLTWGQNTAQIRVLFLIGLMQNASIRRRIDVENDKFGDLIQGSFLDAYRNLTYKHVMLFKYAIYHCPQAKYVLKTDDDVFVNMPLMMNFLTMDLSPFGGAKMLFCSLIKKGLVSRSWRSKWRVSFKEYPGKIYPPYCPGWAILYSQDVVFALYKEAQHSDYFWIDDVHITGTLMSKIHMGHFNIDNNLILHRDAVSSKLLHQRNVSFLYGGPDLSNYHIRILWQYVSHYDTRNSILKKIS